MSQEPPGAPPHGDFAAYVQRLTGGPDGKDEPEALFPPQEEEATTPADTGTKFGSVGMPSLKAIKALRALKTLQTLPTLETLQTLKDLPLPPLVTIGISFFGHIKWLLLAWLATQALARLVPGAGYLFIPVLLVYAGWALFKLSSDPSNALAIRVSDLINKAVEEAQKPPDFPPPKKKQKQKPKPNP